MKQSPARNRCRLSCKAQSEVILGIIGIWPYLMLATSVKAIEYVKTQRNGCFKALASIYGWKNLIDQIVPCTRWLRPKKKSNEQAQLPSLLEIFIGFERCLPHLLTPFPQNFLLH